MDRQTGGGVDPNTGLFVQGDPQNGQPGSYPSAAWANGLTEEVRNAIVDAGLAPAEGDWTQLRQAIAIIAARNGGTPNLAINGSFAVWQRGTTIGLAAGQGERYTADRWATRSDSSLGAGFLQVAHQAPGTAGNPPPGMRHELRLTQQTAATAAQPYLAHRIEDVGLTASRTITVSWWMRQETAGWPVDVQVRQNFGAGGSASVSLPLQSTVAVPGTTDWKRHSLTFEVPAVGSASVGAGDHLEIALLFPQGALFTVHLAQFRVEFGDTATPFEYLPIELETLACRRYFQCSYEPGVAPGSVASRGAQQAFESYFRGNSLQTRFPIPMRGTPTVVWYSPVTGAGNRVYSNESNTNEVVTATEEASSVATGFPVFATALPFTNLEAHWTADAEL